MANKQHGRFGGSSLCGCGSERLFVSRLWRAMFHYQEDSSHSAICILSRTTASGKLTELRLEQGLPHMHTRIAVVATAKNTIQSRSTFNRKVHRGITLGSKYVWNWKTLEIPLRRAAKTSAHWMAGLWAEKAPRESVSLLTSAWLR